MVYQAANRQCSARWTSVFCRVASNAKSQTIDARRPSHSLLPAAILVGIIVVLLGLVLQQALSGKKPNNRVNQAVALEKPKVVDIFKLSEARWCSHGRCPPPLMPVPPPADVVAAAAAWIC
jgi:sensor c-di-GMP phosphodiesterase-like protein